MSLVVRVLSQVAENTVYTFAPLLAVYLVGTALGAAMYDRWSHRLNGVEQRDRLLRMLAVACLLSVLILADAETVKASVLHVGKRHGAPRWPPKRRWRRRRFCCPPS